MKKMIRNLVFTGVMAGILCCCIPARAELKIATVDLRKIFDNYYKTKQADEILKKEADDVQKDQKDMVEKFNKLQDEWKKLLDRSADQALSADERDKAKQQAQTKLQDLREMEQSVQDYNRVAQQKLFEKKKIKWEAIVGEIRGVVTNKCKASGYSLVIDTSGDTMNNTPMVLYTDGQNDVTDMMLKELNATAPVGTSTNAPAKIELPATAPTK